jgi:hypothetical protein
MRVQRDVEIARRKRVGRGRDRATGDSLDIGCDGLGLIGAHQRATARVAEQDDALDAGFFAQPTHSGADVDQRVLEHEERLIAAVAGVPAEKAVAAPREQLAQVVLAEVDVVVGGDEGRLGPGAGRRVVEPLTWPESCPVSPGGGRCERDELSSYLFHGGLFLRVVGSTLARTSIRTSRRWPHIRRRSRAARSIRHQRPGDSSMNEGRRQAGHARRAMRSTRSQRCAAALLAGGGTRSSISRSCAGRRSRQSAMGTRAGQGRAGRARAQSMSS